MKRKRPSQLDAGARKKVLQQIPGSKTASTPLLGVLQQYGLLEAVVSSLCPDDLLALTLSSKAIHNAIAPRTGSLENLLGKLRCPGRGIEIRRRCHRNSTFFYAYECTEYVRCGSDDPLRLVESKPCVRCKVTTCNECRVHCVFQSIYEAPSQPDELPNFSGFVFLEPFEVPIGSPHHLECNETSKPWENPATSMTGPYHDQGYIDVAFEEDATGPPESIEEILDLDLGSNSLKSFSPNSTLPHPSPPLRPFVNVVENRKIRLCWKCVTDASKGPEALRPPLDRVPWLGTSRIGGKLKHCQCTLGSHFLDRWVCLRCYEHEQSDIRQAMESGRSGHAGSCRCGGPAQHVLCLWCWGEVTEPQDSDEIDDVTTDEDSEDSDSV